VNSASSVIYILSYHKLPLPHASSVAAAQAHPPVLGQPSASGAGLNPFFQSFVLSDMANKGETAIHNEMHDSDVLGGKEVSKEEVTHLTHLTEEELVIQAKLRRKIDSLIMPLIIMVYLMNYIDRNNYAAAKLQGLEKDLRLEGDQYQVGLSILFVGYVRVERASQSMYPVTDS